MSIQSYSLQRLSTMLPNPNVRLLQLETCSEIYSIHNLNKETERPESVIATYHSTHRVLHPAAQEIAPFFADAKDLTNGFLPESFLKVLLRNYLNKV